METKTNPFLGLPLVTGDQLWGTCMFNGDKPPLFYFGARAIMHEAERTPSRHNPNHTACVESKREAARIDWVGDRKCWAGDQNLWPAFKAWLKDHAEPALNKWVNKNAGQWDVFEIKGEWKQPSPAALAVLMPEYKLVLRAGRNNSFGYLYVAGWVETETKE